MAIREIIRIDRDLCNGCEECIPNCHEGALQMIEGKATLVSELLCDGLGACIGHCPVGAISIEKREAEPYSEIAALEEMLPMGKEVIRAHLAHLLEHRQQEYFEQGLKYLLQNQAAINWDVSMLVTELKVSVHPLLGGKIPMVKKHNISTSISKGNGCPGSRAQSFVSKPVSQGKQAPGSQHSELRQWPVQMHLINPNAAYFKNSDLLLAADCVAFAMGDFHTNWLKDRSLCIACPKLDSNTQVYIDKLIQLIDMAEISSITLMIMQVPCCGGLLQLVKTALQRAERKIPVKTATVGLQGDILSIVQTN